jgi:hypothetical protein
MRGALTRREFERRIKDGLLAVMRFVHGLYNARLTE